jgi:hypothetical protein
MRRPTWRISKLSSQTFCYHQVSALQAPARLAVADGGEVPRNGEHELAWSDEAEVDADAVTLDAEDTARGRDLGCAGYFLIRRDILEQGLARGDDLHLEYGRENLD